MAEYELEKVVGEKFEDLSISEMVEVQGSGDVNPESVASFFATLASSIALVKTLKGHC
ncbi:lichenicidin A2 family type 2 lantibiotic [Enterococcus plantarum]|uniref:Type 2 lantibiotic n=1 Tax=Enterococcus plantarum TaxID=1077675 RepID=A0A2W3ZBG8_9ENTE|nr:lichenicidin A2 family type 2 lantibiotic [Enterococcus plantarum]MBO0466674.1 lichenicidin A2 family type 2 lantibiotic [Enterococcus plantarum]PZL76956.1 type 2 lantibiotic [Enterococcus plantarum]